MPEKLKDPSSFSIQCLVGNIQVSRALCDLGASVSLLPLSMARKLGMGEIVPTNISLQLADRSIKHSIGILEDVLVKVGKFYIPADFVVLDMPEDNHIPILLGRPFMATGGVVIDVKHGTLKFNVGDEEVQFHLPKMVKLPMVEELCLVEAKDDFEDA